MVNSVRPTNLCSSPHYSIMDLDGHVAIVGGGIVGICTAYYLTRLGHTNLTLLEQCELACHSSGKAGGFLARAWCDGTDLAGLAGASYQLHTGLAEEYPDIGYRWVDTYRVDTTHEEVESGAGTTPLSWLSHTHVRDTKLLGSPENTGKVTPRILCEKLWAEAKIRGAKLKICKVTGVEKSGNQTTHIKTDSEKIPIDGIVLAMGPWTATFLSAHYPEFPLPALAPQTRAHSVVLRPRTALPGTQCLFQYHEEAGRTVDPEIYPASDGNVYVCGEVDKIPLPDDPRHILPDVARCERLVSQAAHAVPELASAQVVAQQACYLPGSLTTFPPERTGRRMG